MVHRIKYNQFKQSYSEAAMLKLLSIIQDPDVVIIKGVSSLIEFIHSMVIKPFSITMGGIPINLIIALLFLLLIVPNLFSNDVNNKGAVSRKIISKLESGTFLKWFLVGSFGLIALIFSL
jgi:hypothetical protein